MNSVPLKSWARYSMSFSARDFVTILLYLNFKDAGLKKILNSDLSSLFS